MDNKNNIEEEKDRSAEKEVEHKNLRYEHMFKFIWFFWLMLGAGLTLSLVLDFNKYPASFCTIGPAMVSTALTFLLLIAKYLIYEKDVFVFDKTSYKDCNKHIKEAENLYIASSILMHFFISKLIFLYGSYVIIGFSQDFKIYTYLKLEHILYIGIPAVGLYFLALIAESVHSIKFKNSGVEIINPLNKVHLIIIEYFLIFVVLFTSSIVLHGLIPTQNVIANSPNQTTPTEMVQTIEYTQFNKSNL